MYPNSRMLQALGLLAACAFSAAPLAATFTVTSPAEFQAALNTAASNGQADVIQVAAGTYSLAARLTYVAAVGEGSLTVSGTAPATAILDGQNSVQVMSLDTTAAAGSSIEVSGLTFRNGAALLAGDTGGGLEIRTGSGGIRVQDCLFVNNSSVDDGGGLYARITQSSEMQIQVIDCVFQDNSAEGSGSDGGGAHLSAGSFERVTVSGCEFTGNASSDAGGGLQIEGLNPADFPRVVSSAFLADNVFTGNTTILASSGEGGGADVAANTIEIRANQFYRNTGTTGGGVYLREFVNLSLVNSVFMGNQAVSGDGGGFGSGVVLTGFATLVNNTVFGNSASVRGGGGVLRVGGTTGSVAVTNGIFWGNSAPSTSDLYLDNNPFDDLAGGARVAFANNDVNVILVKCGAPTCTVTGSSSNINVAPQLAGETAPGYDPHLLPASPLIDAGVNAPGLPAFDFEGDARIIGGTVDIGADESTGGAPAPSADLAITMTDAPDPVLTGGRLTYSITVSNTGPDAAAAVSVTDALPAGVSFVSATPSQGSCSQAAGSVTCSLGAVGNAGSATVALVVDVNAATGVTITNTVNVSSTTADPDATDNAATASTLVSERRADLSVSVTVNPAEPSLDDTVTYTVTVANLGPDSEPAATLLVTLPAIAELESVTAAQGNCKVGIEGVSCTLGVLANGAQTTVTIVMTATETGTLVFEATVDGQLADGTSANNTAARQNVVVDVIEIVVKGKGGKGGVGWLELLGLAGLLLARRARRVLRAATAAATVAALGLPLAMLPGQAQAQSPDVGWYVGASAGQSSADYDSSDLAGDLAERGWTVLDPTADDSDTFWKAYVGYQVNDFLALEAGYAELGEVRTSYRAVLPPSQIDAILQDTFEVHPYLGSGWSASVVLGHGFAEDAFAVFARAGIFYWEADIKVEVVSGGTGQVAGDESGTDGMFGVGAEWRINPAWSLRVEWERYKLSDWVDVPSAGLTWRFR